MKRDQEIISTPVGKRLQEVFSRLYDRYGAQHWWPGDGPFEIIVGAILTQNTAWANADRALNNLKETNALNPIVLRDLSQEDLAALVRPSGYFNAKAKKLKALADHLGRRYDDDLDRMLGQGPEDLREELLSIYGIGEETADDIILYAAGMPSFVIDSYTRRVLQRLETAPVGDRYGDYQSVFHDNLPPDPELFNEYHALLDRHAKETCQRAPRCGECCLLDMCPTGRRWQGQQGRVQ